MVTLSFCSLISKWEYNCCMNLLGHMKNSFDLNCHSTSRSRLFKWSHKGFNRLGVSCLQTEICFLFKYNTDWSLKLAGFPCQTHYLCVLCMNCHFHTAEFRGLWMKFLFHEHRSGLSNSRTWTGCIILGQLSTNRFL
jgi:hypothetical protein